MTTDEPTGPGRTPLEGLWPPLSSACRRRLRRAVLQHCQRPGRTHRPQVHVGEPGGLELRLDVDATEPSDPGLRADLVATLVAQARRAGVADPLVWLTRSGGLETQDVDTRWLRAVRTASVESDPDGRRPLHMVVVNRTGWRDPRSGATRVWVRLRPSPG